MSRRFRSVQHEDFTAVPGDVGLLREGARRLAMRWLVMKYTVGAMLFWSAFFVGSAWLRHWGVGGVAAILFGVWLYFALPALYIQLQLMLDLLSFGLTRTTYFFPLLRAMANAGIAEDRVAAMSTRQRAAFDRLQKAFVFAGNTSPLIGVSFWALIVLARLPERAHQRRSGDVASFSELRRIAALGRKIELAITEPFASRALQRLA
jgi:hypothetical protein